MRLIAVGMLSLLLCPLAANAADVLLLDDGFSTDVQNDLAARGHAVTVVVDAVWDGTNPAPAGFDVVLHLNGLGYDDDFADNATAAAALQAFVSAGGVYAFTEWLAYEMGEGGYKLELDPLMPFDYSTYFYYDYYGETTVTAPSHPLTADLPPSWTSDNDGGTCVDLRPGTTVVMTRDFDYYTDPDEACLGDHPGLVSMRYGAGAVVWFNSDLGHEDSLDATSEQLQVVANMVTYSPAGPREIPALGLGWLALLAALSGLLGRYFSRRA